MHARSTTAPRRRRMRLARAASLTAVLIASLVCTERAHGQIFRYYQDEVRAMTWKDFESWLERATLSQGQSKRVLSLYEQYIKQFAPVRADLEATYQKHIDSWQGIEEPTLGWAYQNERKQLKIGDDAFNRAEALDKQLFDQILVTCADEQIPAIEWAARQRARSMRIERVKSYSMMCGRNYVDVQAIVALVRERLPTAPIPDGFQEILDSYDMRLTHLVTRMHNHLCHIFIRGHRRALAERGDVPSRPVWADVVTSIWSIEGRRHMRVGDRIDELNDRTVRQLSALMDEDARLLLRMEYYTAAVPVVQIYALDKCRKLFAAIQSADHPPDVLAELTAAFRLAARSLTAEFVEFDATLRPRRAGDIMEYHQARNEAMSDLRSRTSTAINNLLDETLQSIEPLGDQPAIEALTKVRNRRTPRVIDPDAKVDAGVIAVPPQRFEKIAAQFGSHEDNWLREQSTQYLKDLVQIITDHPQGNSVASITRPVLDRERALFASLIQPEADPHDLALLDLVMHMRSRDLLLATDWHHASADVDLLMLCLEAGIDPMASDELSAALTDYGSQRLDALRPYMSLEAMRRNHTPELTRVAQVNSASIKALKSILDDDPFTTVSSTYWRIVHPTIAIDADAAHDRFARLIADDTIDVDTRLKLVQRRDVYEAEYAQFTDTMLDMVSETFIWQRTIGSFPNVHGRIPEIEYARQPQFAELYNQRANLSAVTHAYLDTIEREIDRTDDQDTHRTTREDTHARLSA